MIKNEDLIILQNDLERKSHENASFNKKYWIEKLVGDVYIHKETERPCYINALCAKLLIEYYNKNFNLNFQYVEKENNRVEYISPFVSVSSHIYGDDALIDTSKTVEILDSFVEVYSDICKQILKPFHTLKVFVPENGAENFFHYKENDYLLDLEEFYFCVYDENGNNVGLQGVVQDGEGFRVKKYLPLYINNKEETLQENMLVYG